MKPSPPILSKYRKIQELEKDIEEMIKARSYKMNAAYTNEPDADKAEDEYHELKDVLKHAQRLQVSIQETFNIED